MGKRLVTKISVKVHSEICGDCYYNEENVCSRNPEKCIYNIEPVEEEEEADDK